MKESKIISQESQKIMFETTIKNLVPLSVNKCWQGKRFKTKLYKDYEETLLWLLPKKQFPKDNISIKIIAGFSSKLSDADNILKPLLDILQLKYKFNDRDIKELYIRKELVKKGNEFIKLRAEQGLIEKN